MNLEQSRKSELLNESLMNLPTASAMRTSARNVKNTLFADGNTSSIEPTDCNTPRTHASPTRNYIATNASSNVQLMDIDSILSRRPSRWSARPSYERQ
ncbi:hypothetical protein R1flu_003865 [Riccia fluitans]|uniref:Uncharacterized protein n=1 Tax=Riccia fluitans TaxID=41844 RepID=A0ABD1YAU9_9MARC